MEKEKQTPTEEQVEVVETGSVEEGKVQEPAAERKPSELLYERIRTSRPDAKYDEDEEEYSRQAMSMLDEYEGKAGQFDQMSEKMSTRFNKNPEEAEAFLAYLDGANTTSPMPSSACFCCKTSTLICLSSEIHLEP